MKIVKTVLVGLALILLGALLVPNASANSILGTADSFAVLGGSTVSNTGSSVITGNVGLWPGTAISGFPPGSVNGGTIHTTDAVAQQAQSDLTTAYTGLALLPSTSNMTGIDLGGKTLTSGVYSFSTSAFLSAGTLTLDAQGKSNQFWVFQIGSTLITGSATSVKIINAGASGNAGVFWQVGTSATLGSTTSFLGNILALDSITLNNSATILCGRALARNAAVSLDTNTISIGTAGTTGCSAISEGGSGGLSGGLVLGPGGTITPIPEPGTFVLVGCGIFCLIALTKLG